MGTKNMILELRTKNGMSQDELAEKVFVTRQAVSRWENEETTPNTETLKLLSKLFNVSINTLLGAPRQLICQCLWKQYTYLDGAEKFEEFKKQLMDFILISTYEEKRPLRTFRSWEIIFS